MNSRESDDREGGFQAASTGHQAASLEGCESEDQSDDTMKRAAARQLIERYYYQLTDGCSQSNCDNTYCSTATEFRYKSATRNELAVLALDLFKMKAPLCDLLPSKVAKLPDIDSISTDIEMADAHAESTSNAVPSTSSREESRLPGTDVSFQSQIPSTSTDLVDNSIRSADQCSTTSSSADSSPENTAGKKKVKLTESDDSKRKITASASPNNDNKTENTTEIKFLTESKLLSIIADCRQAGSWSLLRRTIGEIYNNPESLMLSFRQSPVAKEEIRQMEGDLDKDMDEKESDDKGDNSDSDSSSDESSDVEDELAAVQLSSGATKSKRTDSELADNKDSEVHLESLRRSYQALMEIPEQPFQNALINALMYLARLIDIELRYHKPLEKYPQYLNIFIIVFELPCLHNPEYVEKAFPQFCHAMGGLPLSAQVKLAKIWSSYGGEHLCRMVQSLQQLITVKIISSENRWGPRRSVNDDEGIVGAARVMKIMFYASIYGGVMDSQKQVSMEQALSSTEDDTLSDLLQGAVGREPKEAKQIKPDYMSQELAVDAINCRKPLVPYEEFINEPLNEYLDIPSDHTYYRVEEPGKFSFMNHNFILSTSSKQTCMYFDNRMRMLNERRTSWLQTIVHGAPSMPFLRLRVRRDHLIDDALVRLEMIAMESPSDLKKQLLIEFEGEQGLDEGGLSKEFFQLVVEEIFNPDFGMFTYKESSHHFWFNSTSFENDGQFTLIGIILGLSIYNNAILDIHFPMVVYRKLMGKLGTFGDLSGMDPVLAQSLKEILSFDGDVQETFMQYFNISYSDVFGETQHHNLKHNGDKIPVTNHNRQEFVDLYSDFILNKSIEKQFRAFKRGFHMVTDESPFKLLFRPEEIELLVCGSENFDFKELERSTDYDGGFQRTSTTVRHFWEVVHDLSDHQKRKLLQFSTGTDRVPVGGLAKLKLIIARNGPDSDRLPTSHTCFNVLLLPEYNNKAKLKERLLKAITYSKGFGLL